MNSGTTALINSLPDEILLSVFRHVDAYDFVISIPFVCRRWFDLIASDVFTLKRVCMLQIRHDLYGFSFLENESPDQLYHYTQERCEHLLTCAKHVQDFRPVGNPLIFKRIETLMLSKVLLPPPTNVFPVKSLKTLLFFNSSIQSDMYPKLYNRYDISNLENLLYVKCVIHLDPEGLHVGFNKLKRFHLDHYFVSWRFLEGLLEAHPAIETIVLGHCTIMDDKWIDVLTKKLKGRTIKSLDMHSAYFTDKCVNKFLATTDLFHDTSMIKIHRDKAEIPFTISIMSQNKLH